MVQWREVGVTQHAGTMGVSVCGVKRMTSWVVTDGSRAVKPVLIGPGGQGKRWWCMRSGWTCVKERKNKSHQHTRRYSVWQSKIWICIFLMYSLCWKIKATLPNSKYVIMFIHLKKKLYMQLLTGSWGTSLDGNWISIDMGTDKESSMVLMNFSMRNLYHIGSECYGSHSILISVACPLKTSWSPIECRLCFCNPNKTHKNF